MSAPDYGEPWDRSNDEFNEPVISDRNVIPKADCFDEKEADRIIACVNACAGIEDPERVVPLLVDAAASMLEYAKDKTFYPLREECRFVEHLTKLSDAIAALQPKREGET